MAAASSVLDYMTWRLLARTAGHLLEAVLSGIFPHVGIQDVALAGTHSRTLPEHDDCATPLVYRGTHQVASPRTDSRVFHSRPKDSGSPLEYAGVICPN